MSKIVKFPKVNKLRKPAYKINFSGAGAIPSASTIKNIFFYLFYILRLPIFLLLYWLRMPVLFVCNMLSVPMLFAWLFAWYAFPDKTAMVWSFATVSLLTFIVAWAYDFILMVISPQDMIRTL